MSLGRLPFSGLLTVIVLFGMPKSFHSVFTASSILIAVLEAVIVVPSFCLLML